MVLCARCRAAASRRSIVRGAMHCAAHTANTRGKRVCQPAAARPHGAQQWGV
ncbi:hypothetical protein BIFGAL_03513 [Bifidobacterium gallicum DSM 20093 = LMG 11596]|uniref:Uncharacterized protein n=1 Tax=Bifidobacterium gallicum DSM 20093 = LMG 11596 TaxID=561180 RepID=D1NUI8_9BIFI|nr:hypothetical protein BIFGAL_03513 [Bifidobacterium gallicum DSM 20093 = LMG 11596]